MAVKSVINWDQVHLSTFSHRGLDSGECDVMAVLSQLLLVIKFI